jgi:hypothetical protein
LINNTQNANSKMQLIIKPLMAFDCFSDEAKESTNAIAKINANATAKPIFAISSV